LPKLSIAGSLQLQELAFGCPPRNGSRFASIAVIVLHPEDGNHRAGKLLAELLCQSECRNGFEQRVECSTEEADLLPGDHREGCTRGELIEMLALAVRERFLFHAFSQDFQ